MGLSFTSFIPLIILLVLFLLKVPISFSLIASSLFYFTFINTSMAPDLALQNMISSMTSFPILAIPFFITAGVVMNYSGISSRLLKFSDLLVGHKRGSLGYVNVLLSTLMGGISGSSNADAAMQCKILVPEMEKRGYSKEFSAAVTASSSLIPSIIPPGLVLLFYATVAKQSIGKLFFAGYIPGLLLCAAMLIVVAIETKKYGFGKTRECKATGKEIWQGFITALPALFLPLGLLAGLRFGLFTATEGGAICVLYCFIVGIVIYREIKPEHLKPIISESVISTAEVMFILAGANLFGYYLSWERIPYYLSEFLVTSIQNKYLFLLYINVFLLIAGMFVDAAPLILIIVPLLLEPVKMLGIDPIHFGLIVVLNLQIGGLTPPFGTMMFIVCSMLNISIPKFVKANTPFYIASIIVLFICTYLPDLVLFLPNLVYQG